MKVYVVTQDIDMDTCFETEVLKVFLNKEAAHRFMLETASAIKKEIDDENLKAQEVSKKYGLTFGYTEADIEIEGDSVISVNGRTFITIRESELEGMSE